MRSRYGLTLLLVLIHTSALAVPNTLDELLNEVHQTSKMEQQENDQREAKFQADKQAQQAILLKLRSELASEEARGEQLRIEYEENVEKIAEQEQNLADSFSAVGELHGVVRQISNDMRGIVSSSLVSAEFPEREVLLNKLSESKEMPSINELEDLWHTILKEMVESGKVSRFESKVITTNGEEQSKEVTRIGTFNASSGGLFLRYLPESGQLVEPGRQPPLRFQQMANALENSTEKVTPMVIDPTRGAMLALLVQKPNLEERIRQGGIIGYIIIALGLIALLIALERFIVLAMVRLKINKQIKTSEARQNNPLGRIMAVYTENPSVDSETLGLKLDEAILRELPKIKRGLRTLAILAAIAPLLGLLGTVTGIIETFQSITLYGTGDPRLMSGGISQALVTTVLGLIVAIPILLLHSVLSGKSNALVHILDEKSAAMVANLAERKHASAV